MNLFASTDDGDSLSRDEPPAPLSVSAACSLLKRSLERIQGGRPILVSGEIGDFRPRSGQAHWYFSLRDEDGSTLNCAFFSQRRVRSGLDFEPVQGMSVLVEGSFDYYAPYGKLSFIVTKMAPQGDGPLHERFEKLRLELQNAGWFSDEIKIPLPAYPRRIAMITSSDGAVQHDIERTARELWPGIELILVPVPVQGEVAAPRIVRAIKAVHRVAAKRGIEAVILARGGGSLEDLWAFNTREVVDAIYQCRLESIDRGYPLPFVSAIGHESDTTLAELVSDLRASTPTQAAMHLLKSVEESREYLDQRSGRMRMMHRSILDRSKMRLSAALSRSVMRTSGAILDPHLRRLENGRRELSSSMRGQLALRLQRIVHLERRLSAASPVARQASSRSRIDHQNSRLIRALDVVLAAARTSIDSSARHLAAIGPDQVLQRGYSITLDEDGRALRDSESIAEGDVLQTRLSRGVVRSTATNSLPDTPVDDRE